MSATQPRIVFHLLGPSHPCAAVEAALKLKGLDYERVELQPGAHVERMAEIYGAERTTVPGAVIDDEPVHGSNAILERLEAIAPEPSLFPDGELGERVVEAMAWGDAELQPLGRSLPWGSLHFRPEAAGTFAAHDAPPLDPAGTDFAIKLIRGTWKYHKLTAVRLADDLAGLPAKLDRVDAYVADGVLAGEQPNAADLQIGSTLAVLRTVGDVRALIDGRPAEQVARRWFDERPGLVPVGAFPAGWVPSA
ncbi:MAG TPA: glutathione S-transferase N-terminal domain-containing protein [Baekduia sp.]|uniref:glutathione S-transferase family protein n=1 Tax=Baekduia sp. TaxID=2600305 RepID=UPI002D767139|nr:glutathione S-transferase N-terminal domain-containing protein [Baekduia sp.]HET6506496.1 glutathione S-transferase N-terminal domain-containing protein [Baekduia sp.]